MMSAMSDPKAGRTTPSQFRLADGSLVLAATDLTNHLARPHLTQQRLAIARCERAKARPADDPHADLVRTRVRSTSASNSVASEVALDDRKHAADRRCNRDAQLRAGLSRALGARARVLARHRRIVPHSRIESRRNLTGPSGQDLEITRDPLLTCPL